MNKNFSSQILVTLLAGSLVMLLDCGGGDIISSGEFGITIDTPAESAEYSFFSEVVSTGLSGGVMESPLGDIEEYICGECPWNCGPESCHYVYYPRVEVAVTNLTNGEQRYAEIMNNDLDSGNIAYVGSRIATYRWMVEIPLKIGENNLLAEAYDGEGNWAQDEIVILTPDWEPVAVDDIFKVNLGQQVTIEVLANDTHPGNSYLQIVEVTQGSIGTVEIGLYGAYVNYLSSGVIGPESFTYTVMDANGSTATGAVAGSVLP